MRRYINRLWIRLSIISSLMVLIGVLLVALGSVILTRNDLLESFVVDRIRADGGLLDQMASYYRENHSWSGVEKLIDDFDPPLIRGPNGGWSLTFADEAGTILFDPHAHTVGQQLNPQQRSEALPVNVDGQTRGYVHIVRFSGPPPANVPPESLQPFLFRRVSQVLLLLALAGGVVGISAGIFLSRGLTAPLNDLAKTVREFGAKNFSKRAKVWGSEEIVAVASAFNNMADALEQAEIMRRNLVADVAHELRTPLTILQANLQAILDGVYPNNEEELQKLMEQTELLSHLINDLHELTQLEAKQLPHDIHEVDLARLVASAARKFEAVAAKQGVALKIETPPDPLNIQADPNRIQQIVNNLVQNALTHTPSGGSVTVSVVKQENQALIRVEDTGNGILSEHLPHVFERFYRIDPSRSRATGGAGLGLAIVKAIAEMHGGQASVASEGIPGHGSTFSVFLPTQAAAGASSS